MYLFLYGAAVKDTGHGDLPQHISSVRLMLPRMMVRSRAVSLVRWLGLALCTFSLCLCRRSPLDPVYAL